MTGEIYQTDRVVGSLLVNIPTGGMSGAGIFQTLFQISFIPAGTANPLSWFYLFGAFPHHHSNNGWRHMDLR